MRLIANYTPLGGVVEGDKQMLWGTLCTIANIGTEDSPKLLYVADVDKGEAEELVATGRFQAIEPAPKASKAGKAEE
jgi:hypothetical protein